MSRGPLVAAVLLAAGLVGPCDRAAWAGNTGLEPLTRRDQLLGWEAVGRIDLGDDGFCTGALIATNLVLTAAHCVFDSRNAAVDPATITFRAGYAEGTSIREVPVARTVVDPSYVPGAPVSQENVRYDVALLELSEAVPAAVAAPFAIKSPGKGDEVSVVSYAVGREESLSWQRICSVLARTTGLVAMDCDVSFGSSGAPVFDRSGGRARIVSIISAGGPTDQGTVAYGMELPQLVEELKARLRKGEALATAGAAAAEAAPKVRRLGSDGSSRDIGARFVKP